ncbi:hypothetical protein kam1_847 [Methylacidiphilum kamchatkense Kam1]|uniref:Uncharacterized protein n=1 Tax=Methylacidiphilum kamchatkense Kam1 TaxID=1202785 RepID=A0A516TLG6_9BACT|nr:hypothetical protein kam1_847 [Methylacidiphilum kamchatkense Kam1]
MERIQTSLLALLTVTREVVAFHNSLRLGMELPLRFHFKRATEVVMLLCS